MNQPQMVQAAVTTVLIGPTMTAIDGTPSDFGHDLARAGCYCGTPDMAGTCS
jgi:hypothetical protein